MGVSPPIQIYFFRYCPRCPIFDPTVRPSVPGYSTCTVPGTWMGRYVCTSTVNNTVVPCKVIKNVRKGKEKVMEKKHKSWEQTTIA